MPYYRVYCFDGAGRITQSHEIEAGSDEEAILLAEKIGRLVSCELWQRDRIVAKIRAPLRSE